MVVATTPVENIGIGGVLIVETHDNQDHYIVEPFSQKRIPVYTKTVSTATEAHRDLVELMRKAWYCRDIHNRLTEV